MATYLHDPVARGGVVMHTWSLFIPCITPAWDIQMQPMPVVSDKLATMECGQMGGQSMLPTLSMLTSSSSGERRSAHMSLPAASGQHLRVTHALTIIFFSVPWAVRHDSQK